MAGLNNEQLQQLQQDFPALGGGAGAQTMRSFIEYYYKLNSTLDLERHSTADLVGAARYAYELALQQQRKAADLVLEVYNPSLDEHGWHSTHTVVHCVQPNKPFLVDSLINEIGRQGLAIHFLAHPAVHWQAEAIHPGLDSERNGLSIIHIELDALPTLEARERLRAELLAVLTDVRHAVADWSAMLAGLVQLREALSAKDSRLNFLDWLRDNRFTFLGYRYFALKNKRYQAEHERNLGVLRSPDTKVFPLKPEGGWHPLVHKIIFANPGLLICKGSKKSKVHRSVHPDIVMCKQYRDGREVGVHLWLGLFTSASYQDPLMSVPILQDKILAILEKFNFHPDSHSGKALLDVFHKTQRDELLQMDIESLYRYCLTVLELQERQRLALFIQKDSFQRYITATIFLPKDKVSTNLRAQFANHLARAFAGKVVDFQTVMSNDHLSRIQYIISVDFPDASEVDEAKLLGELEALASDWPETLRAALVDKYGEARGLQLMRSVGSGFPGSYQEHYRALVASNDAEIIEQACEIGQPVVNLGRDFEHSGALRCKLYAPNKSMYLSDIVPILEDLGVRVLVERPHELKVKIDGIERFWLHDFLLQPSFELNLSAARPLVHEHLQGVFRGDFESDALCQLIMKAGLSSQRVSLLRMFSRLLQLLGGSYSTAFIRQTLVGHPRIAQLLLDLLDSQLADYTREQRTAQIDEQIEQQLAEVQSLAEDTVLNQLRAIVKSGVRYSFDEQRGVIAFKFAPQELSFAPSPAPWREVFVYAPHFEAVHFRFGNVARGGLRWSDRSEDFRTEILGLVKAQQVKNAVIVPKGAKGGFVLKGELPKDRKQLEAKAVAAYQCFMATLLGLTDNRVSGSIERHGELLRADPDDPYLVVAADKGTAAFSDYANEVAVEHNFWLGDAFASGGSQGYDHKKMGITARGAWEVVRQHFYELGKDIQQQSFSAIGVGDMGGDVFGNGMLLSEHTRLLGAFNHQHIFIDPDPDCARSFAERQRLFAAEGGASGWGNYQRELLSAGGDIFERRAKLINLSPQAQRMLGLEGSAQRPDAVIRALLRMQVDLLWFGGIGTYIKASSESHAEINDRGNDALRVDAAEVQARVIGEGANLGISAQARVEFNAAGSGRCNADFIDNCAGVNCSDHEVNIKILLALALEQGELSERKRNDLLREMTDAVAELVLQTSREQGLAISASCAAAARQLHPQQRLLSFLERIDFLDRAVENLPDDKLLAARERRGQGFLRPELCTLQSYAKNYIFDQITGQGLELKALAASWLPLYFPALLQQRYPGLIEQHPLGAEIIATKVTNAVVDIGGMELVNEIIVQGSASLARSVQAFLVLEPIFGLRQFWRQQLELLRSDSAQAIGNINSLRRALQLLCIWLVNNEDKLDAECQAFYQSSADQVRSALCPQSSSWAQLLMEDPVSAIACLKISRLKRLNSVDFGEAAQLYQQLEDSLQMDELIRMATSYQAANRWQQLALRSHQNEVEQLQLQILTQALAEGQQLQQWLAGRAERVQASTALLLEIRNQQVFEIPMLKVAIDHLKKLI